MKADSKEIPLMPKDASFDIVSDVDMQEVDNAFQQTVRELAQRYDLKGAGAAIEFSRREGSFLITAPSEFVAGQVVDVLGSKLVKRGIDLKALRMDRPQPAAGMSVRQTGRMVQGIDPEVAKRISKDIRDTKLKVKPAIEGGKLRVSASSKDALQSVIAFLRDQDYGQPLQFANYR